MFSKIRSKLNIVSAKISPKVSKVFKNRKTRIVLIVLLVLAGSFGLAVRYKSAFIAARVNNKFILRRTLVSEVTKLYGPTVLDEMITEALVREELRKNGVSVSDGQIDERIAEIEKSLGGVSLTDALSAQNMNMDELRRQIALQLGVEDLLAKDINVTPEEVDQFLATNGEFIQADTEEAKRDQALDALIKQKLQQAISSWIVDLRDNAKIDKYL